MSLHHRLRTISSNPIKETKYINLHHQCIILSNKFLMLISFMFFFSSSFFPLHREKMFCVL